MKLPKLPNPASVLDAKYTAAQMKEYAKRVQLMEREECASVCENIYTGEEACGDWPTPEMCAKAIRARGQA